MEKKDLIDIWKKDVDSKIPTYYRNELEKAILSKDKRYFRNIHSLISLMILIIGILFFITLLFIVPANKMVYIYLVGLILFFGYGVFLWVRSYIKINKNTQNKSLKEWLRFRIEEIEKNVPQNKKESHTKGYVSYILSLILIITVCILYIPDIEWIIILIAGISVFLQNYHSKRKLEKQLKQFKKLYELLVKEESLP